MFRPQKDSWTIQQPNQVRQKKRESTVDDLTVLIVGNWEV